jgi:hypothetical protein
MAATAVTACSYATPEPLGVAEPASWSLDPAFDVPGADAVDIPILVEERECASGRSAEGRIAPPVIELGADEVRITISVFRAPGDFQTCQSNPATPFVVVLPEPLGDRELVGDAPGGPARLR